METTRRMTPVIFKMLLSRKTIDNIDHIENRPVRNLLSLLLDLVFCNHTYYYRLPTFKLY